MRKVGRAGKKVTLGTGKGLVGLGKGATTMGKIA